MNEAETLYKLFFTLIMVAATQGAPSPTPAPATQTPSPVTFSTPTPNPPDDAGKVKPSVMGVEFFLGFNNLVEQAYQLNAAWVRFNGLFWNEVEPTQGERRWDALARMESDLIAASKRGMNVILVVRKTPAWAQSVKGLDCTPPTRDHLPAFAAFMRDLVARYSQPPFNVKYWEMGNEVDLDPADEGGHGVWGCWGNRNDEYFGGGYYADMLKQIYPAMKQADPNAQVLVGGLMLECGTRFDACREHRFLEGVVRNGGGPFFDGVGYHAYDGFTFKLGAYENFKWDSRWDTNGTVTVAKLNFLRSVLNRYNVAGKYFVMTEGSVLCWECSYSPPEHDLTKAYYVPQLYAAGVANDLKAVIWYSYNSQWMQSALVDKHNQPVLAHTAMRVLHQKLGQSEYVGALTPAEMQSSQARGYKFRVNGREVWLMWALTLNQTLVTLPATPQATTDVLGNTQPAARAFALTTKPLYIEW